MNRPDLYKKTVNILFDAYFNDTLQHDNPCGCAVGNLVAAGMGYSYEKDYQGKVVYVGDIWPSWYSTIESWYKCDGMQIQIESTGYSATEIIDIEKSFESSDYGESDQDYMFNGLVAVLEILKQIHEVEDNGPDVQRFRNHYQTLTV